ncbi:Fibrinogen-like protein A,Ryncolin-4,Angiopoietin-related protein 7,Angiopoietin-related protein 1,Ficolin-3,Ficolin-1-B,Techylectin-5A,Ficolin-2,Ryncolin-1,Tenascin-R,Fibrinogen-like protein 1,Angiopoietin-1,Tenascin-X,Fibrinogen C domain-containing protein 1-A,Tenascin-N,Ryncolin-3,Tenascin,Fibroleukin,Fibrinogen C domain-containing protein 1,Fibrinogen gamma chain,Techylectin-like protein,Ryncolin-2,Techylectin-5B,Angiopoietin-related protein 2,Angiopoietin-2,Microfibril-associated glycoprotein 4,Fibrin|uniref:Fibrinogen C-terminal domain-containing protein n=1 Tax=Mytilus coruscus TaxID=42192 RepID=A0A6J8A1H1_MYTCO|nr:Fibrinogen-like protein A,Ryncolin-4,Angiopoietin-related protein 7,Angiopoietin-related protein 1,Ficolin-3,Ficolin-1-B,Techylectin-5A,Ficolin-2,Ryncolin-1,Tenascin-R,Fibrinogen-like protein 1,Angiopoietin-1,Tenascin-X,Fibrinogen C domain-containing protein 1-A,Tenascin-N,Ryncolin-3,Tenascin,Fibroleukin,Fibrinogen C domain-containing protein 1,Fibrinogen gamma chain,Techylectin-like protein,Ryncolin-2,Techylectin-5B,Angiopoietin-related protein 2,Angiopoietin-2,Microfibril-associated glycoprote
MNHLTILLVFLFAGAICEIVVIKKQKDVIYSDHVLFTVSMPMWLLCAQFCSRVEVCKSINFIERNKTCQLNDAEPGESTCRFIESTGNSFVAASTFPQQLAGQCKGNYCKCNEACMPRGPDYYCVPLPIKLSECSTQLRPRDCSDLPVGSDSGVYTIYPTNAIFDVYCDMDTAGFGWTVFQSRMNGTMDFNREWMDYENGFGSLTSEFWLGNNFIHLLTSTGNYKLYIHLEDFEGNFAYADYFEFSLGDSATNYILNVKGYCGTAGDSLKSHNGTMFSSIDKDNDKRSSFSCARNYKGAWWYNACHTANLNGEYLGGKHTYARKGIIWTAWKGIKYSLKSTKMMIKRH